MFFNTLIINVNICTIIYITREYVIVMDRDGWSGKSLIINILLSFHIGV